jgi:alkanesulfonate monooxygenase SsuD/methylene tetrahydromethanopterin reductase-like flavin-dependent oxidoreductase (luciferase family)
VQAGASEAGLSFAAAEAELIYSVQPDKEAAREFRKDLRVRLEKAGRDPTHIKIMPGVVPIISESEEETDALISEVGALANPATAMRALSDRLGRDLSDYPLDGPVPELPTSNIMQGHAKVLSRMAREKNMTLRQLRDHVASCFGHRLLAGKPEAIADGLQEWFEAGAADGFVIMPLWFPDPFDRFATEVVPILQKRGLFRKDYTGTTLREHLGLPRPPHPATMARRVQAG